MKDTNGNARPQWPGDPAALGADGVDFGALAHVLGNTCCWGGRSLRFYSVAQHAVTVADAVGRLGGLDPESTRKLALHALLAESWRAWLPDGEAPDESAKALEKRERERAAVQRAVLEAAGHDGELPESWTQALGLTQRMAEAAVSRDLSDAAIDWAAKDGGPLFPPLKERVRPLRPERAAARWLERFRGLRPEGTRRAEPGSRGAEK